MLAIVWAAMRRKVKSGERLLLSRREATWLPIGIQSTPPTSGQKPCGSCGAGFATACNGNTGKSRLDHPDTWLGFRLFTTHQVLPCRNSLNFAFQKLPFDPELSYHRKPGAYQNCRDPLCRGRRVQGFPWPRFKCFSDWSIVCTAVDSGYHGS